MTKRTSFLTMLLIFSIMLLLNTRPSHAEALMLSPENGAPKSKHPVTSPVKHKKLKHKKHPQAVMDSDSAIVLKSKETK